MAETFEMPYECFGRVRNIFQTRIKSFPPDGDFRDVHKQGNNILIDHSSQAYAVPTLFFVELLIVNSALSAKINNSFLASASSG